MTTCAECRHYIPNPHPDATPNGVCRRYPPTVVTIRLNDASGEGFQWQSLSPLVLGAWTCGEWVRSDDIAAH
jgi:hypothetical protein